MMGFKPSDYNNSGWESGGEQWPRSSPATISEWNAIAHGRDWAGTKCFYYNPGDGSISASLDNAELLAAGLGGSATSSKWKKTGVIVPSGILPFTYGSTKGVVSRTSTLHPNPGSGTASEAGENNGVNGTYFPIFYKRSSTDSIVDQDSARNYYLYNGRKHGVRSTRPSGTRSGFYFTDVKLSSSDIFTGIYTNSFRGGTYIILGVHYPSLGLPSPAGKDSNDVSDIFRFELRQEISSSEYRGLGITSNSTRKDMLKKNIFFNKLMTHPGQASIHSYTVNLGLYGEPCLWTTDVFPDADSHFYGPIDDTMTWELPPQQLPWMNEQFTWQEEGGPWTGSGDDIKKTYWNENWSITDFPAKHLLNFETEDLEISVVSV
jgi:hypothetical protein